jgi:hypothetical protein
MSLCVKGKAVVTYGGFGLFRCPGAYAWPPSASPPRPYRPGRAGECWAGSGEVGGKDAEGGEPALCNDCSSTSRDFFTGHSWQPEEQISGTENTISCANTSLTTIYV